MTKKEYAQSVAEAVGGEAREVEKANGVVYMGVIVGDGDIRPTVYVDRMYDEGVEIERCAEIVKELTEKEEVSMPDFSRLCKYNEIKGDLRLRLFNEATHADVFMPADSYGFAGIIIVPYLENVIPNGSIRITESLLKVWDVDRDVLFADASTSGEYEIISLEKVLREFGDEDYLGADEVPQMYIVTNKERCYGGYGVIALKERIGEMFPEGYVVIPSSVHECIVFSSEYGDTEKINGMVREVNSQLVPPEEVLGDRAYVF